MHSEVHSDKPGRCPKCGMKLLETEKKMDHATMDHSTMKHEEHVMKPISQMSFWQRFKMSMTMSMGMEHGGLAGREMAKLMEEDIRNKFFFSLILTIPIILYSPLGEKIFGIYLPSPIAIPIPLVRHLILNSTQIGDLVWDGFGGSGTTLIACQQARRICVMTELSPDYCQTIISRFQNIFPRLPVRKLNT